MWTMLSYQFNNTYSQTQCSLHARNLHMVRPHPGEKIESFCERHATVSQSRRRNKGRYLRQRYDLPTQLRGNPIQRGHPQALETDEQTSGKKIASRASGCTRRSRRTGRNFANPDASYHGVGRPNAATTVECVRTQRARAPCVRRQLLRHIHSGRGVSGH